jgi:hypothetical protein
VLLDAGSNPIGSADIPPPTAELLDRARSAHVKQLDYRARLDEDLTAERTTNASVRLAGFEYVPPKTSRIADNSPAADCEEGVGSPILQYVLRV